MTSHAEAQHQTPGGALQEHLRQKPSNAFKPEALWSAAGRSTVVALARRRLRRVVLSGALVQHLLTVAGFWEMWVCGGLDRNESIALCPHHGSCQRRVAWRAVHGFRVQEL